MSGPDVVVVGVGADGWRGLGDIARDELRSATTIAGSRRQLDSIGETTATRHVWASPMLPDLRALLADPPARPVHVLASGDPMFHGVGATIVGIVGAARVRVIPAVSSVSLAAARLGWDLARTRVVSLVTDPVDAILAEASDGVRLLVLGRDETTPGAIAATLTTAGFGASTVTALADLGGDDEAVTAGTADRWDHPARHRLCVIAVDCRGPAMSRQPGRPDAEYESDGQLTKAGVRSLTLAALRPAPRQVLWDVGGGSGSIAIEWLLSDTTTRATVFESDPVRRARVVDNARRHGVSRAITVAGTAPAALTAAAQSDTPRPDAVFIGGGITTGGVLDACWQALRPGGRLVANAVTVESESVVVERFRAVGGDLRRIHLDHAAALGSMTTWRPILPVTQWSIVKPEETS